MLASLCSKESENSIILMSVSFLVRFWATVTVKPSCWKRLLRQAVSAVDPNLGKKSCVSCSWQVTFNRFSCHIRIVHSLPRIYDLKYHHIPLSIKWWAGKGLIVNDEGETSWSGNHWVNLVYVREKHPAWLYINSEGAAIHNIVTSNNAPAKSKIGTQKQLEKLWGWHGLKKRQSH